MKLGTALSALAAATLVVAQPALAATRSASSLPAAGVKVTSVDKRAGSRVGASEEFVGVPIAVLLIGGVAFVTFLATVVLNENSFDDLPNLPDSP